MEFTMWKIFLAEEEYKTTKQDLYLAQIAAEIERTVSKKSVSIKKKILKFVKKSPKKLTVEEATVASKKHWFGWLGLDKDGTNTKSR